MFVPHKTGAEYVVHVYNRDTGDELVWEGHATHVVDAYSQARIALGATEARDNNTTWKWHDYRCKMLSVTR